ncbi:aspartic peptidase domain-containing protein [Suillus clintonianus]|uniref:aspartic peptidase domain-containing protein n=1 Tax=Suillus clintonianus TaxID=1904413 RepID=UPI001B886AA7|nr:aspartic peptidase domain-containing protein [Suillus clintonianus]KAG2149397.1 aspartic peptidase domain-containing protein [Suillus clintonianus]
MQLRLQRGLHNDPSVLLSDVSLASSQEYIGGQDFWITFDTGSSDLWVVSSDCTNSDCAGITRYSPPSSSTLTLSDQPFKLTYLMGSVLGTVGTETVTLGPYEILSQTFALANQTSGLGLSNTGNSGILGLSFPLAASIPLTSGTPVLNNIFSHFGDQHRFFAFKLGRNESRDISHSDSSFTIGELDSSLTNDTSQFVFTPVFASTPDEYDFWKLPIQEITINSQVFPLSRSLVRGASSPIAVLDTGTTLILGPTGDVNAFWYAIGTGGSTRFNQQTQTWQVRCERAVDVRIKLGNSDTAKEYPLHPGDVSWAEGETQDGWCTGGIQANNGVDSGDWLLGAVFLRNVYVIHHGTTSSNPPMIGLLNTTDPSTALAEFISSRGPDPAPPPSLQRAGSSATEMRDTIATCVVCGVCGFLIGVIGIVIYRLRQRKRSQGQVHI